MRRARLLALLLLAATASAFTGGTGNCPTTKDFGGPWIDSPEAVGCASAGLPCTSSPAQVSNFTVDRVARSGRTIVTVGSDEVTFGVQGSLYPELPGNASTAFGLHFGDARSTMNWPNTLAWLKTAKESVPAGATSPIFVYARRADLESRQEVIREGPWRPSASWFLRSPRTLAQLAAAFADNGNIAEGDPNCLISGSDYSGCGISTCRIHDALVKQVGETYGDPAQGTGCGRDYTGASGRERGARMTDFLDAIEPGLSEHVAYYKMAGRPPDARVIGYGYEAMANMLEPAYQAAFVDQCRVAIAAGFDACQLPHKNHFYWSPNTRTKVESWPAITGDGLGGSTATNGCVECVQSPTELAFSGPLRLPNGDPFEWAERSLADVEIQRAMDAAGLKTFVIVNPYWFEGCPKDWASWDSPYEDVACGTGTGVTGLSEDFDDPASPNEEDAQLREYAIRADYCVISLGGKSPTGSIGSGGGSGWTYYELKNLLETAAAPDGTPCEVVGWEGSPNSYDVGSASTKQATPPILCAQKNESNPAPKATCGNGVLEPGEECDDGNTANGDTCNQWCLAPDVFVVAGQSNAEGRSTQGGDIEAAPSVTSPDSLTTFRSRVMRSRYLFDTGAGFPVWADANSWPCAVATQCTETTPGSGACAARTAANNGTLDADCPCHCGTSTDSDGGNLGELKSAWPTFAQRYMQDQRREVRLISVNRGATSLVDPSDSSLDGPSWDSTVDCSSRTWPTGSDLAWRDEQGDLYCLMLHAVAQSGYASRLKAVLWQQGEEDAGAGISTAAYEAALNQFVDDVWADLGVPTLIAPLGLRTYPLDAWSTLGGGSNEAQIRTAQLNVIASNPHAYMGADPNDLEFLDSVHIQDVKTLGERWAEAATFALAGNSSYAGGRLSVCGNGITERGEQCDDGNTTSGDGCSSTCLDEIVSSTVDAQFVATTLQGTTCVAPCAVHFDAIGNGSNRTTDSDYPREFHTLDFRWDFDDPGAGVWKTGSGGGIAARNADEGAIAGHLYTVPGTYNPVLTVTAPDGDTDTATTTVTVVDPDTLTTICVANVMPTAGAGGCPAGATTVSNSDFDDALSDTTTGDGGGVNGGCNADFAKVRCLFKGGDTFTASTSVTLTGAAGTGVLASYGTGQAIVEGPASTVPTVTANSGWMLQNVEWRSNATNTGTAILSIVSGAAGVSFVGNKFVNHAYYGITVNGATTGNINGVAYFDNSFAAVGSANGGDAGSIFTRADNLLVYGSTFDASDSGDYQTRHVSADAFAYKHNSYIAIGEPDNAMQLRACSDGTLTCGGAESNDFGIVADNLFTFQNPTAAGVIRFCETSTCGPTGAVNGQGGFNNVIVERNFFALTTTGTALLATGMVQVQGSDITIRNNVADYQGLLTTGTNAIRFVNPAATIVALPQARIQVYNNTIYTDDAIGSGRSITICDGGANVTSSLCYGNLLDVRAAAGSKTAASGAGWTAANNVISTAMPFIATPPAQGSSRAEDFNPNVGSQADGAGFDFTASTDPFNALDAGGCRRAAPWDAGAWQIGATGCLPTEGLIGINSEKMLANAEAILFADAIDNSPQLRHTADPATSREESFFRSYRTNLSTLEAGITIPTDARGWPSVDLPYDDDGAGPDPAVVARMDLMAQESGRPIAYPAGTYTLRFDGTGTVQLTGDGTVTCTGTDQSCTVSITPSSTGVSLWITSSDPGNAGDPITEVDLLLPGYTSADQFYWPTIVRLRPFAFLRGMNAIRVNDYECSNLATGSAQSRLTTCQHTWAARTQPTGIQASRKGISWEKQIALANAAQVDLWATIPHAADDTYVSTLAAKMRDDLLGRTIVELSNEVGNEGDFAQGWYFINLGDEAGWGSVSPCSSAGSAPAIAACQEVAQPRGYVHRAAEVADLFDAAFTGPDAARLVKVLGTFPTANTTFASALISALGSGTYNPTGASFDAIAIGPYFAGTGATVSDMLDDTEVELAGLETYFDAHYAVISAAGMEMFAYEGGPILDGGDATSIAANDDVRMEQIAKDFFALWFANGGRTTGAGFWIRDAQSSGLLRYPTQDPSPKWLGYRGAIEAAPQP